MIRSCSTASLNRPGVATEGSRSAELESEGVSGMPRPKRSVMWPVCAVDAVPPSPPVFESKDAAFSDLQTFSSAKICKQRHLAVNISK